MSGLATGAAGALGVWAGVAVAGGAYLLGAIPFSYLIVKLARGRDVRTVGSGNVGATNVMRAAGKAAGAAALLLDCGKGVAAVVAARALGASAAVVGAAAAAVVIGHVYPVFLGFRGGKGVATAAGALGALEPAVLGGAIVVFILVVAWKRYVSLGSIAAAASLPLLLLAGQGLGWMGPPGAGRMVATCLIAAIVLVRHGANLDRLRRGAEPRLGRGGEPRLGRGGEPRLEDRRRAAAEPPAPGDAGR